MCSCLYLRQFSPKSPIQLNPYLTPFAFQPQKSAQNLSLKTQGKNTNASKLCPLLVEFHMHVLHGGTDPTGRVRF